MEDLVLTQDALLIMDILVEFQDGSLANVEVQKVPYLFPAERLVKEYPWLYEIYEEAVEYMRSPEALRILDRNTVHYMIEEQQKQIEEQAEQLKKKDQELERQAGELEYQARELALLKKKLEAMEQQ